ncbi:hypothetical protein AR457_24315 [Streptomyces agglomeratus]|uniref:Uncharacterized protein n=1 Tax=Streptomyces agglomeratus TaxID=285458 RepID=A0A1E5PC56_9ACTN|nr:hypothetical protein [Streptomyces agglomeratus]OEJ27119.1 hypothetical protein AS594_24195 [Streptomyces agglomeratus]OEJ38832.1 hypothetical protein BGK70_12340 [Streptomyces agglomeratus]OEJ46785.1 hypothetical protein AR457_24315 [Streptomyces agglomeratus]OEJ51362.1 hypothetical protein BGK72_11820 [Streptomyces agglomeratus]
MTGRGAVGVLVAGAEIALVTCLVAGVRVPPPVVVAAEAVVLVMLLWQGPRVWRLYADEGWAAVRAAAPVRLLRLVGHELRALHSLALWVARRRHGVGRPGAYAAPYTGPQTAMMYGLLFVAVVETVMLALLIPWPAVHAVVLFLDVYTVVQILGLHAGCVTRPHVVAADGSLRIRYGGFYDVRVPAAAIGSVRVDRRHSDAKEDGVLGLGVGGQTTVLVELTEPVSYLRPLGARAEARAVRFHADDPRALVAAVTRGRTPPSPIPGPPV